MVTKPGQQYHYTVKVSVTANGDLLPDVDVTVNGTTRNWHFPKATNEVVFYLAILSCVIDAVANGAHSALVEIGNQTATRQLNGSEKPRKKHIRALNEAVIISGQALPGGLQVI
ncbi:hypothetical protein [Qipengyuania spongiae]|uniref:OsmC family peroxiredoxin n=1 Tax=Qipengyuania spongiae TaxID=2909673 RepID=A0ABY5T0F6_9SPHN|nr:hypothetical protein [Qipengyuania spongiae]UVI38404.1 hypothetical protein L1F33_09030 [Qipengyuania spongiae]